MNPSKSFTSAKRKADSFTVASQLGNGAGIIHDPNTKAANLLWTGGWDSTYRLLETVLCQRYPVQPWYVIDRGRASTETELQTMSTIREAVKARDPWAGSLIRDTNFVELSSVLPDPQLEALHRATRLGSQYGWLPRFAKQYGLDDLELGSVQVEGGRMCSMLRNNIERIIGKAGATYRVVDDPEDESARLFQHFEFPIIMLSKDDIRARAEESGFLDLMQLTWTCHAPRRGKPCGTCAPCMVMMQTNMAWRIPPVRRIRPLLRLVKARARRHLPI